MTTLDDLADRLARHRYEQYDSHFGMPGGLSWEDYKVDDPTIARDLYLADAIGDLEVLLPLMEQSNALDDYQHGASKTAQYPEVGTGSAIALAYVGLGLGEAGEVQGKIKKILRDDNGILTDEKREQIAAELGDVLWYVAMAAREVSVPLSQIAAKNLTKLASRQERGVITGSGDDR